MGVGLGEWLMCKIFVIDVFDIVYNSFNWLSDVYFSEFSIWWLRNIKGIKKYFWILEF